MGIKYATREQVKAAADIKLTAGLNASIDRLIESYSRTVEKDTNRIYYPLVATRYYDWPALFQSTGLKLWLNADLQEVTAVLVAGDAFTNYYLEPQNYGPPFNQLQVNQGGSGDFAAGSTSQRSIAITGIWGFSADIAAAGALAEADDGSETELDITNSALIGVGDLIFIGDEAMIVTEKALLSTTATISGDLAASQNGVSVGVDSGAKVKIGEVVTIDAERMLVEDIAGNSLIVKRAYDGSTLATHTSGATVYAPRTITVERGAAGTTTASHSTSAAITKNVPPGLINELVIAEVLATLEQEGASFGRTVGTGDSERESSGKGVVDLRNRVKDDYRRYRMQGLGI